MWHYGTESDRIPIFQKGDPLQRREFCKIGGLGLLTFPFLPTRWSMEPQPSSLRGPEQTLWFHGSPYLGHSDFRRDFRGLDPCEIRLQIAHFRTAEPWRRKMLFNLKQDTNPAELDQPVRRPHERLG